MYFLLLLRRAWYKWEYQDTARQDISAGYCDCKMFWQSTNVSKTLFDYKRVNWGQRMILTLFDSEFHFYLTNTNKAYYWESNCLSFNLDKPLRSKLSEMRIVHHFDVSMTSFSSDKKNTFFFSLKNVMETLNSRWKSFSLQNRYCKLKVFFSNI